MTRRGELPHHHVAGHVLACPPGGKVNANSVLFQGTTTHPSGAEWSVRGSLDRITGSLGAAVTWFNPRTKNILTRMNYELICKPT